MVQGRHQMGNKSWKWLVFASILATLLCAACSSKAEEKAQPRPFNSKVAFDVYAVIDNGLELVGNTPSERPLTIPRCQWWYVVPGLPVDMEKVGQEVEVQGIPGLSLRTATDADLDHLKGLTGLQRLYLADTQVTDAGLEHLKGLTALRSLNFAATKVTDAGLEHLKGLTGLRKLDLELTRVTDAGLLHLEGLRALQELNLVATRVTDAGLAHLKELTALEELNLMGTQVTDAGLEHLKGLTALQDLDLRGTTVTEAGIEQLQKSLPNLGVWR